MRTSATLCDPNPVSFRRWLSLDGLVQQDLLCFQISQLRCCHLWSFESVVLKEAFLHATIWELHATNAILYAMVPLALVTGAILPVHLTIAMSLIVLVAAFIVITALPGEQSHAILLVIFVGALIHVAVLVVEALFPLTLAMLESVFELADVDASIFPLVLALTFGLAHVVRACEAVAICKDISSLTVLQAALPLSFVAISVFPLVHTVACGLRLSPLANV